MHLAFIQKQPFASAVLLAPITKTINKLINDHHNQKIF